MLKGLKKDLRNYANPEKAKILQRFFKTGKGEYGEGDLFLGVVVPQQRAIARQYWKQISLDEISELIRSAFHEERLLALLLLVAKYQKGDQSLKKSIFSFYTKHIRFINNWDLVDLSAPKIVGPYLEDKSKDLLYKLTRSKNVWERRIAIMSTFDYLYKGHPEETFKISEMLLKDPHDLIHKAVGWMLREAGKRCSLDREEEFLKKHGAGMPRTMLRYAIEKFPPGKRKAYLKL